MLDQDQSMVTGPRSTLCFQEACGDCGGHPRGSPWVRGPLSRSSRSPTDVVAVTVHCRSLLSLSLSPPAGGDPRGVVSAEAEAELRGPSLRGSPDPFSAPPEWGDSVLLSSAPTSVGGLPGRSGVTVPQHPAVHLLSFLFLFGDHGEPQQSPLSPHRRAAAPGAPRIALCRSIAKGNQVKLCRNSSPAAGTDRRSGSRTGS